MISDQMISEITPSTAPRVDLAVAAYGGKHRLAHGVERARADIAVDDTDTAKRQRPETLAGLVDAISSGGGHGSSGAVVRGCHACQEPVVACVERSGRGSSMGGGRLPWASRKPCWNP